MRTYLVRLTLLLALLAAFGTGCVCMQCQEHSQPQPAAPAEGQTAQVFEKSYMDTLTLKYLLYLPDGYATSKTDWPLVLFLHGSGERGDDLDQLTAHGLPQMIAKDGKSFPFIVVSPQCPNRESWTNDKQIRGLSWLLDDLQARLRVDKNRIYVTGLGMGGMGTWRLAQDYPDRFAAIVPMSGGGDPTKVEAIRSLPIWAFHGAKDPVVPIKKSQDMVDALKAVGSDVKFTIYPEGEHDCWAEAYGTPELYDWMLKQKRRVEKK